MKNTLPARRVVRWLDDTSSLQRFSVEKANANEKLHVREPSRLPYRKNDGLRNEEYHQYIFRTNKCQQRKGRVANAEEAFHLPSFAAVMRLSVAGVLFGRLSRQNARPALLGHCPVRLMI